MTLFQAVKAGLQTEQMKHDSHQLCCHHDPIHILLTGGYSALLIRNISLLKEFLIPSSRKAHEPT